MTRSDAINFLANWPYKLGHMLGFTKLTELHNEWIRDMIFGENDETLQAHRGSYKTTCVSIALTIIIILYPNDKTLFMRKTDTDIQEVIAQVKKMLKTPQVQILIDSIWGIKIEFDVDRVDQILTNLARNDPRGTPQLFAMGINSSLTGKHFDRIFTDDIINRQDRVSRAEREKTKEVYQELQNIKNQEGRIFNTGTPWHKEDAFLLMPNPKVYDCYSTGLISENDLASLKEKMTASLFAANYEMRHIASDDIIFKNPAIEGDPAMVEQGECHIDAAYGGEDYSAFTICRKHKGIYYVFGKLRHKHIDDCEDEFLRYRDAFNAGLISCETNADKGYLAKELKSKGARVHKYHEDMNKFVKITSYLKAVWKNVIFVKGTDKEYIDQICEYNIDAEHDDAPDSLSSIIRKLWGKADKKPDEDAYLMYL